MDKSTDLITPPVSEECTVSEGEDDGDAVTGRRVDELFDESAEESGNESEDFTEDKKELKDYENQVEPSTSQGYPGNDCDDKEFVGRQRTFTETTIDKKVKNVSGNELQDRLGDQENSKCDLVHEDVKVGITDKLTDVDTKRDVPDDAKKGTSSVSNIDKEAASLFNFKSKWVDTEIVNSGRVYSRNTLDSDKLDKDEIKLKTGDSENVVSDKGVHIELTGKSESEQNRHSGESARIETDNVCDRRNGDGMKTEPDTRLKTGFDSMWKIGIDHGLKSESPGAGETCIQSRLVTGLGGRLKSGDGNELKSVDETMTTGTSVRSKIKLSANKLKTALDLLEKKPDGRFKTGGGGEDRKLKLGFDSGIKLDFNSSLKTEKKSDDLKAVSQSECCAFCENRRQSLCKTCSIFYCKTCLERLHPDLGPYIYHEVIPIEGDTEVGSISRCREHSLAEQLFCSYCEVNRCMECVKTTCRLHFKGKVSSADIEKEKELLFKESEKASDKYGIMDKYREQIQREILNTQMTGLMRKEQIRKEFVSFHDLLIQKEEQLLQQLDQEVNDRVRHMTETLEASVKSLQLQDATLTTTIIELVQSSDDAQFIENYVKAKDLCKQVDVKLKDFEKDWAKNINYTPCPVLDNNFTMLGEKRQLDEKLDGAMETPRLQFKQRTLVLDRYQSLKVSKYMVLPKVPPSTEVSYHVQLIKDRKAMYEVTTTNIQELAITYSDFLHLGSFLLRIMPTYRSSLNNGPSLQDNTRVGAPCHMLIFVQVEAPNLIYVQKELDIPYGNTLQLSKYLVVPTVAAPTHMCYKLKLLKDEKTVYQMDIEKIEMLALNTFSTYFFLPGRYVLQITPISRVDSTDEDGQKITQGDMCQMVINVKKNQSKTLKKATRRIRR